MHFASNYCVMNNNPILFKDPNGDTFIIGDEKVRGFKRRTVTKLVVIRLFGKKELRQMVRDIHKNKEYEVMITSGAENKEDCPCFDSEQNTIYLGSERGSSRKSVSIGKANKYGMIKFILQNGLATLSNELSHAYDKYNLDVNGIDFNDGWIYGYEWKNGERTTTFEDEVVSQERENMIRRNLFFMPKRETTMHGGGTFNSKKEARQFKRIVNRYQREEIRGKSHDRSNEMLEKTSDDVLNRVYDLISKGKI